jgi:hypothetical protein
MIVVQHTRRDAPMATSELSEQVDLDIEEVDLDALAVSVTAGQYALLDGELPGRCGAYRAAFENTLIVVLRLRPEAAVPSRTWCALTLDAVEHASGGKLRVGGCALGIDHGRVALAWRDHVAAAHTGDGRSPTATRRRRRASRRIRPD